MESMLMPPERQKAASGLAKEIVKKAAPALKEGIEQLKKIKNYFGLEDTDELSRKYVSAIRGQTNKDLEPLVKQYQDDVDKLIVTPDTLNVQLSGIYDDEDLVTLVGNTFNKNMDEGLSREKSIKKIIREQFNPETLSGNSKRLKVKDVEELIKLNNLKMGLGSRGSRFFDEYVDEIDDYMEEAEVAARVYEKASESGSIPRGQEDVTSAFGLIPSAQNNETLLLARDVGVERSVDHLTDIIKKLKQDKLAVLGVGTAAVGIQQLRVEKLQDALETAEQANPIIVDNKSVKDLESFIKKEINEKSLNTNPTDAIAIDKGTGKDQANNIDEAYSLIMTDFEKYTYLKDGIAHFTFDGKPVAYLFADGQNKNLKVLLEEGRKDKAEGSLIGGQRALDKDDDGDIDGDDFAALRENKAHGSLSILMTPEMMPVDTYPNMSPEEEKAAKKSQLPDEEMEDNYIDFVMDESLSEDEQDYLAEALEKDNKLSEIMDKVITTASEFSGAGEVDGPGTGVSDSIPARLSDGEFVFTKKATDQIGVDKLQTMMDDAEREFDKGQKKQMAFGGMLTDDPMQDEKQKDYMEGLLNTEDAIKQQMIRANRTPSVYANLR